MRVVLASLLLLGACSTDVNSGGVDAGAELNDGGPGDAGASCPEGTEPGADGCVDVDECAVDNGGCGDAEAWRCENRHGAAPRCIFDCSADRDALMAGVDQWLAGNRVWPSALIVHGPQACPLVRNEAGKIILASGRLGSGKVLLSGHEHPMNRDLLADNHDGARMIDNLAAWAVPGVEQLEVGRHPGQFAAPARHLAEAGHNVVELRPGRGNLASLDLYFYNARNTYADDEIESLNAFIRSGGTVVVSGFAWAFEGSGSNAIVNFPGNRAIAGSGLSITKANQHSGAAIVEPMGALWHGRYAAFAAARHLSGEEPLSIEDRRRIEDTVGFAVGQLPLAIEDYYLALQELLNGAEPVVPTAEEPIRRAETPMAVLMMRIVDKIASGLPAEQITAHPAAADFPGLPEPGAEVVSIRRTFDASYAGLSGEYMYAGAGHPVMVSTGAYALPGQAITVTLPPRAAEQGLQVQIGTHEDRLWNKDEIKRFPQIIRRDPVLTDETISASAFGGPVFILVPAGANLGEMTARIEGAVCAPHYIHGETSPAEFAEQMARCSAPWVELETDRIAMSVLRERVALVDDIPALMSFWDEVMEAMAVLEGSFESRPRAERFTLDRQISVGWLHSGYPVMGHLENHDGLLDLEHIYRQGSWGPFHELGHNFQWRDWFLPGTTETTCNLWSVYIHTEVLGLPTLTEGRVGPEDRASRRADYLATGPDFSEWKVWVALDTYLQLMEGFGWELYSTIFADYRRGSTAGEGSAEQRIDEWVQRTCDYTERNLVPFYEAWGFPIGGSARGACERHPVWEEDPMR